ncbi:uncharacterized protein LOC133180314 [Saccostrea echinata]|uniref:uncharacterized protein LOC133180314 n=1 Tax=Saccostrea echinata TaxID=191078 RepID=UPI002A8183F2|nr:uncharacterized protein LOC133180314 [Saccostrea echinata]
MEPAMAVKMIKNIKSKGHTLKTLVMDDDTSTICKVREEVDPDIEKCSDKNHTFKNLTNHLFTLQKEKYKRILSTKTITHIKKCFAYAVSSNRGNPSALKANLIAIPHHLFGNHSTCDSKWCRYLQNKESYIPRNLPYGRYLSDTNLHEDLLHLSSSFAGQVDKLSSLESTQGNGNFNYMVSMKNPKNNFYSGSESTSGRVAAAVCETKFGATICYKG